MADHLESVKALASQYRGWARDSVNAGDALMASRRTRHAEALEASAAEIEESRRRLQPLTSTYGDLSDLPPEVLAELSVMRVDDLEQQLRDIVAANDGAETPLDPIIIELYRRHKAVHPRRFIMNKLYRMAQKGLIFSVDGKKGVYYLPRVARPQPAFDSDLDDDVPF